MYLDLKYSGVTNLLHQTINYACRKFNRRGNVSTAY